MKRNGLIFLCVIASLAILLSWFYFIRAGYPNDPNSVRMQPKIPAPVHEIPSSVVKNMDDAEAKREKVLRDLSLPQLPIIYAKVIDESGRPVSDVKVVVTSSTSSLATSQEIERASDSDGRLSFSKKWLVLSITLEKPGYRNLVASSATFRYSKIGVVPTSTPDPENPVIFVLQRM